MGCDIHCYIEYRPEAESTDGDWRSFAGRINPGRDYGMFGIMAGVRADLQPVVPPRGFPEDAGWRCKDDNIIFLDEKNEESAKNWVENKSSVYIKGADGKPYAVTNPDWHTHSWLTLAEFEQAMHRLRELEIERCAEHNKFLQQLAKEHPEAHKKGAFEPCNPGKAEQYEAVLAAMKSFQTLGFDARLVFWFDN